MEITILIFDDCRIERVSCDRQKIEQLADELNGPGCFGPYIAVTQDLEDCQLQSENDVLRERLARLVEAAKKVLHVTACLGFYQDCDCIRCKLKQAIAAAELSGKTGEVKANKEG